jgi:hypothetical protein
VGTTPSPERLNDDPAVRGEAVIVIEVRPHHAASQADLEIMAILLRNELLKIVHGDVNTRVIRSVRA